MKASQIIKKCICIIAERDGIFNLTTDSKSTWSNTLVFTIRVVGSDKEQVQDVAEKGSTLNFDG